MKKNEKKIIDGIEYTCFKKENGKDYLVTTDVLTAEVVKEIIDDERNRNGRDIRYNTNVLDDSWENSIPRKILNDKFKEKYLKGVEIEEEVRLLTKEEVESLDSDLHDVSDWYWTMTSNTEPEDKFASVFYVYGSSGPGYLSYNNVYNTAPGVRPVVCLKSDTLTSDVTTDNASELACGVTNEKLDKILEKLEDIESQISDLDDRLDDIEDSIEDLDED